MALDDDVILQELRGLRADMKEELSSMEHRLSIQIGTLKEEVANSKREQGELNLKVELLKQETGINYQDLKESRNRAGGRLGDIEGRLEPLEKNALIVEKMSSVKAKTADWVTRWIPILFTVLLLWDKFF